MGAQSYRAGNKERRAGFHCTFSVNQYSIATNLLFCALPFLIAYSFIDPHAYAGKIGNLRPVTGPWLGPSNAENIDHAVLTTECRHQGQRSLSTA